MFRIAVSKTVRNTFLLGERVFSITNFAPLFCQGKNKWRENITKNRHRSNLAIIVSFYSIEMLFSN
jgi:hypothetical protein